MRNLFFLFFFVAVVVVFVGCDPHFDSYVPREIVHVCAEKANGILDTYVQCLKAHGCVIQPDPMPLSETPVYICK
jgi:hypothetical protein